MIRRIPTPSRPYGERGTALSKRIRFRSLSVQLLISVLISLLASAVAFGISYTAGDAFLDHTVYGEPFSDRMSDRLFEQMQEYVERENVTTERIHLLNAWCSRRHSVYLTVYEEGALVYESPAPGGRRLISAPKKYSKSHENAEREYGMVFSDGHPAQVFLYYSASDGFFFWMLGVSFLISFAVFCFCLTTLIHRKLRYIQKLKKELDILAGGDLEYKVTVQGQDELSELAFGIDEMRRSILTHQRAEEEIRSANSQLVTAMSHDLRTPLTSLLAYLEILDRDKVTDEEQRRHLIRQSLTKTMAIKSMADKLFEYIFVYTSGQEQPEMEKLDADELFGQFCQEYAFSLESHGFAVETDLQELDGTVEVNTDFLRRAFDNLYANILKYADQSEPVRIVCGREDGDVRFVIDNAVPTEQIRKESTNIGLNTCRRIFEMHKGSFETKESGGRFSAGIRLPLVPKEQSC